MAISYAAVFQTVLDKTLVAASQTAKMEAKSALIKYDGGSTVNIPRLSIAGMGDYSRSAGYPNESALQFDYQEVEFDMDRGIKLTLDRLDPNDTNFALTSGVVIGELGRTVTAPEIEAYRFSKIFKRVLDMALVATLPNAYAYKASEATIFSQLKADLLAVQDAVGEAEPLTIYMNSKAASKLYNSTEWRNVKSIVEVDVNGVKTKFDALDDIPIIRVPSARMRTAYDFAAGTNTWGYSPQATAGQINWMIVPDNGAVAVTKTRNVKVFSPDENQGADGWLILARLCHVLDIMENSLPAFRISFDPGVSALTVTVEAGSAAGNTKATATAGTGNKLGYKLTAASIGGTALKDVHIGALELDDDNYTSAADIAAAANQYLTVVAYNATTGLVVSSYEKKLAAGDIQA